MPTVVAAWVVMVMTAPTITIHICDGSHKPLATTQIPMPMRNGVPDVDRLTQIIHATVAYMQSLSPLPSEESHTP